MKILKNIVALSFISSIISMPAVTLLCGTPIDLAKHEIPVKTPSTLEKYNDAPNNPTSTEKKSDEKPWYCKPPSNSERVLLAGTGTLATYVAGWVILYIIVKNQPCQL